MKKLRIKYNKKFLLKLFGAEAIVLYPYVLFRGSKESVSEQTYLHEYEHVRQVRESGFFSFYVSYIIYNFAGLIRYRNCFDAYYYIPYEEEARLAESDVMTDEIKEALSLC